MTRCLVLLLVGVIPGPIRAQTPRAPLSQADLVDRLARSVDSLAAAGGFAGVVLLARRGAPVFERAYGMAVRAANRPNTIETAFNIGSINKVFTSIAIRQLAAQGKLDLDSTLATSWPDYPNPDVARRVTIRQLLQHRSGIGGNIFTAPAGGKRSDVRTLQDYLLLFVNEPLAFEPGSRMQYSNAGYVVLGLLVERLSGENYYDYVRQHIYEPAGMSRTAAWPVDSLAPNTALGYTTDGDTGATTAWRPNSDILPGRGSSAGGGYSTAHDLLRFLEALRAGRIPAGPPSGLGIAGGAPGLNAVVEGDLPGGYDLIVLANLDPPAAERIAQMVRAWLGISD
jgi:CubicO group peptidase (beta-lactamase class C family)